MLPRWRQFHQQQIPGWECNDHAEWLFAIRQGKVLRILRQVFLLTACLFLSSLVAGAQELGHQNTVEIKRRSNLEISLTFALNLPTLLHKVLAPKSNYAIFLKSQVELTDKALDQEIALLNAKFSKNAFLTLPSGAKVNVQQWQLPDKQSIRDALTTSLILLNMPDKGIMHVDPLLLTATAQIKSPVSRIQLQLPPEMNPILVSVKSDNFWLTDQIPMAIFQLD